MRLTTFLRLGFGLLLLSGSLSVTSCKTEDVGPRDGRKCGDKPTTTSADTTTTGNS